MTTAPLDAVAGRFGRIRVRVTDAIVTEDWGKIRYAPGLPVELSYVENGHVKDMVFPRRTVISISYRDQRRNTA